MKTLTVKAGKDIIGEVMDFMTAEMERHSFPANLQTDVLVAVEEILSNIADYAYPPGQEGDVTLSMSVAGEAVVRFEDTGKPYNPLEKADPALDIPLMEREIGGLGIYFVKNLMDKVEYEYTDNKNVLTITKGLKSIKEE
jgi:anti-sigma regulatory factor (Ser/Thr protein kinase)